MENVYYRSNGLQSSVINSTCVIMSMTFVVFVPSISFGMAYDFIDSVGNDVDVVSDSEVSVLIGGVYLGCLCWAFIACSVLLS